MKELLKRDAASHAVSLRAGEYSSEELTRAYLERIEESDGEIGAFITVTADKAIASAKASDMRRLEGKALGIFDGVPIAVKDNICTRGTLTTCASKMLADYIPPYSATAVERLERAGILVLGKLNMDEFGMGASTENSAFKITRNPYDTSRVAGGSSGGCAAAVAAFEAPWSLGSDTGGSVRQPASFCGAVGMKSTYGRVSRSGLVAFAPSLEQIGPITKNVRDNANLLSIIAGADVKDATSLNVGDEDFSRDIGRDVRGLRVGMPRELFTENISDGVGRAVMRAAKILEDAGAEVTECSLPSAEYALAAYYVISSAEASSNLARFDGVRYGHGSNNFDGIDEFYKSSRAEGFGTEVKRRIMLGTFALSSGYYDEYYKKALGVRSLVKRDFEKLFEKYDILLSPVSPSVAYRIGEKTKNPTDMYTGDLFCVPANIAGIPALSLPCGTGEYGMPAGVQLMGKRLSESLLYRVGAVIEDAEGGGV
ncbi:MAG: Asp-tRNA(Asn)/Glu-tRNA(Gln) amidotransferase subunit GatA [Clostridia bacterium]|nr:Asp-tRNA(Asn)/Glu-tRNA(Gln) amidotransferase subunit GatA [Clostridia bacterium]